MKVSIITTLYGSGNFINEFYSRIVASVKRLTNDYEIIFVNDGSPDDSLDKAVELHKMDPCVKIVDLSRNFGHHKAIRAGLEFSTGELVFFIDCDLEEPPELLNEFYNAYCDTNSDVIYGIQECRSGGFARNILGGLFYKVFNLFSDVKLQENLVLTRLMTKKYVEAVLKFREDSYFIPAIFELAGFKQNYINISRLYKGETTYTLKKRLLMAANAILSFSPKPLYLIFRLGLFISVIAFIIMLKLMICKLAFNNILTGWTSLMVTIWFLGGLILFSIGVLGIYMAKIFDQVKRRPLYIVKELYSRDTAKEPSNTIG